MQVNLYLHILFNLNLNVRYLLKDIEKYRLLIPRG